MFKDFWKKVKDISCVRKDIKRIKDIVSSMDKDLVDIQRYISLYKEELVFIEGREEMPTIINELHRMIMQSLIMALCRIYDPISKRKKDRNSLPTILKIIKTNPLIKEHLKIIAENWPARISREDFEQRLVKLYSRGRYASIIHRLRTIRNHYFGHNINETRRTHLSHTEVLSLAEKTLEDFTVINVLITGNYLDYADCYHCCTIRQQFKQMMNASLERDS